MQEKILSIFIDESGDFGPYAAHTPYYIVSMVLHEQHIDISGFIQTLDEYMNHLGFPMHAIHVGPLIRRESIYADDLMEDRKKLFSGLFNFARKVPFTFFSMTIKKDINSDVISMTAKLSRAIGSAITQHNEYFQEFDKIILYYDNGQVELTKILTSVFSTLLSNVEFRKVVPTDYKLFQVADLICSLELLNIKCLSSGFSKSELEFFHSAKEFRKNYYKPITKKRR